VTMSWLTAVGWYITSVMGDRDYQNYVAHLRRRHPDAAIPTEREYWRERYADAAANPRVRCC
jgi:uncharacterized short protein YbdD (DUF466 family)